MRPALAEEYLGSTFSQNYVVLQFVHDADVNGNLENVRVNIQVSSINKLIHLPEGPQDKGTDYGSHCYTGCH